jgi:hypothetical protein
VVVTSDGNVGIGITNPNTKLHVGGIVQVTESSNTAFYGGNYVRMFSDQNYGFRNSGGTYIANISMSGNSYFNGGNVGIGTTSPSEKLHVYNGSAYITPIAYAANQNDWVIRTGAYNSTSFDQGLKIKSNASGVSYMSFENTGGRIIQLRN